MTIATTAPTTPSRPLWRRLVVAASATVLAAATAACGAGGSTGNEAAVQAGGEVDLSKVTLVVGDQKGGSEALLGAAGELDDLPYEIEWKQFTSGPPLLEALNSGAVHVGGVGNTPPLFAAAAQGRFKVVQGATYTGKGDALVVPKDSPAQDVADLAGKTIAVAPGSSANYHLLAQLSEAGVSYDDVTIKELQPADALAAFSQGHLDAWAIWEPFTSQAEVEEQGRVLADGTELANGYTFQVASDEALDEPATRAAMDDYLARIVRALRWSSTNKPAWAKVWSAETGLSEPVTLAAVQKRTVEVVPIDDEVVASEQEMADAFVEAGLLPERFDVADWFSPELNETLLGTEE